MNLLNKIKENKLWLITITVILAESMILFGLDGLLVILGIIFLLFLPTYMIIRNFNLEKDEKLMFSFFGGVGLFPFTVYLVGFLVGSLRWSVGISFVLLICIGLVIRHFKKKNK